MELKKFPVEFDKENHVYTLNGKLLTGVTTILDIRAKDFLKFWTTKENYNYMMENWDLAKTYTQKEKEALLLEAKNAHARKSKKALDKGHQVHEWLEQYVSGQKPLLPADLEVKNACEAFLAWEKEHKVEWLASELIIVSPTHSFAGTLDALANVDGKLTIIDFKTSSQISEDYYLQTAGYAIALAEMGCDVQERLIIRVPKDGSEFEAKVVPTPMDFDKECFIHCREIHRWNINYKNNYSTKKF